MWVWAHTQQQRQACRPCQRSVRARPATSLLCQSCRWCNTSYISTLSPPSSPHTHATHKSQAAAAAEGRRRTRRRRVLARLALVACRLSCHVSIRHGARVSVHISGCAHHAQHASCSGGPPRNPTPQPKHISIPRPSAPPALARITLIAVFLVLVSVSHDDTLANTATHALPECIGSPHMHPHTTEYPGPPTIDPITNLQSPTPVTNTLHTSLCRVGARGAVGACGCRCRCRSRHAILASCTQRPRARGGTCMCSRSNVRHRIKRNELHRPLECTV